MDTIEICKVKCIIRKGQNYRIACLFSLNTNLFCSRLQYEILSNIRQFPKIND